MSPLDVSPTGYVILGMLSLGKQTGYDIKQFVDKSTRFFWAASYGQIYPELRRLEDEGLISGQPEPRGGRARTVYTLTPAGEAAFTDWLDDTDEQLPFEVRAEGMLKLFFSDVVPAEQRVQNIRTMRARMEAKLAQLRALEPKAGEMRTGPALTLGLGITFTECFIQWCEETERALGEAEEGPR